MCTKKFYYFFSKFLTTPNSFFTLEKLEKKIGKEKNLEYYRIETFPKQKKKKTYEKHLEENIIISSKLILVLNLQTLKQNHTIIFLELHKQHKMQ